MKWLRMKNLFLITITQCVLVCNHANAQSGKNLYTQYCSACHAIDGNTLDVPGVPPLDNLKIYSELRMSNTIDMILFGEIKTTSSTEYGRVMPLVTEHEDGLKNLYNRLSVDELTQLIKYISTSFGEQSIDDKELKKTITGKILEKRKGEVVLKQASSYDKYCLSCHGDTLRQPASSIPSLEKDELYGINLIYTVDKFIYGKNLKVDHVYVDKLSLDVITEIVQYMANEISYFDLTKSDVQKVVSSSVSSMENHVREEKEKSQLAKINENKLRLKREEKLREEKIAREKRAVPFRENLEIGNYSNCGLVISVKPPIAEVQIGQGKQQWMRIDQLYPSGDGPCITYY